MNAFSPATWIWYPGDFEIWLSNNMQNRRTERNTFFPVFWKVDSHYPLMDFHCVYELSVPETIEIFVEGKYNVKLDGIMMEGEPKQLNIPAGKHKINIKVFNQASVPSVFIKGSTIRSDNSWLVTFEDKEWIDETGKTSDISATKWLNAGCWNLNDPLSPPSRFSLPVRPMQAAGKEKLANGWLVDFGRETFGFLKLHGLKGSGKINIYYGESKEEAMSVDKTETLDRITLSGSPETDHIMPLSKAFRYVQVQTEGEVEIEDISMLYEYLPVTVRGGFRCSDTLINQIYDVSKYTFELNNREFFIDGIKRDRWIWSGDAYQSYLMNYYLNFDNSSVTRTLAALRGKDPVTSHINTIMDYTFYWFLGIYDYYLYTGDAGFIRQFYPRMQSLMQYCLDRRNKDGWMEGLTGDWVFIDWADGLSKKGAVSMEQLLFCRSLETMAICAEMVGETRDAENFKSLAAERKKAFMETYWNPEVKALVHSLEDGKPTEHVTRYANMFAIFFGYLSESQKLDVKENVLLNKKVPGITTPYMRFYELESLCAMGEQSFVLKEMRDYWGGMLQNGATSFWELYNPAESGSEHYSMYGRPFGKSLCHAWGASPLYLLGRYYLGVSPTAPGYSQYNIQPSLGDLQWMEGKVPTPQGDIEVYSSRREMRIKGAAGTGTLRFKSKSMPGCSEGVIKAEGSNTFVLTIEGETKYHIEYEALP